MQYNESRENKMYDKKYEIIFFVVVQIFFTRSREFAPG